MLNKNGRFNTRGTGVNGLSAEGHSIRFGSATRYYPLGGKLHWGGGGLSDKPILFVGAKKKTKEKEIVNIMVEVKANSLTVTSL